MTIESVLIAKNRDQFNNIISFMKSLIFKNETEANEVETVDTLENFNRYEYAYIQKDSSLSYSFSKQQLIDFGFTEQQSKKYFEDPRLFQTEYMNGNVLCKLFLNKLRKQRVDEYVENNPYYRQFCGLPYDESQYISVLNNDRKDESEPETIYLHEVNTDKYPNTYSRLFYEREVEKIYKENNYMYLIFLEKPMSPYDIRNRKQFDICYYDETLLSASELQYWFECYEKARNEIMLNDYIDSYNTTYKAYDNVMLVCILSFAFNLYCSKMLEKFAVRDYTDSEIMDIIESNDLNELKSLNMPLLRRIVQRLPDLKAYTGTDRVIDIIFDIVADASISVKRYYIKKKYNVDTQGNTDIDKTHLYDKSVDLVFQEKTIKRGADSTEALDQEYSYDSVVMSDDTWGATQKVISQSEKLAIKEKMKKEILKSNFSSIMTKYISVSKIIDINVKMIDLSNKLGLLYQYCNAKGNKIANDNIVFEGIETTALSIFAAWCIVYGTINGLSDPDKIPLDRTIIEGVMKLRTSDKLNLEVLKVKNLSIDLGKGYFSEVETLANDTDNDIRLSELLSDDLPSIQRIKSKHPIFSHFSLQKGKNDPITYKLNSISSYGKHPDNETFAYDSRTNLKCIKRLTKVDTSGNTKTYNEITEYGLTENKTYIEVLHVDDDFDENNISSTHSYLEDQYVPNPDYRKVFKYDTDIEHLISISGTRNILLEDIKPVYVYNSEDLFDGLFAYDGNNLSGYIERVIHEDSKGRRLIETKKYRYDLTSALPILTINSSHMDEGFDISDPLVVRTEETEKINNPEFLKIYMYNNGTWDEAKTAWVETDLKVDSSREIILPANSTHVLYSIFKYANTVGDYLTDKEIEDNLVVFKPLSTLTIDELYAEYDKNYEIIEAIKNKIIKAYDFSEYQLWDTIYKANLTHSTMYELFKGSQNYSEYILSVSQDFYDYLDSKISAATTPIELVGLEKMLYTAYSDYIKNISNNYANIYTNESDIAGGEDLTQISLLFKQFVSLYTQLYKSSYNISYDDAGENSLILLYSTVRSSFTSKAYDILELAYNTIKDVTYAKGYDYLILEEFIIDKIKTKIYEYLSLDAGVYDGEGEFIPDMPFKQLYKDIDREYLDLEYKKHKDDIKFLYNDSISLIIEQLGAKTK